MAHGRVASIAALIALIVGLSVSGGVVAQDATPDAGPGAPPPPEGCVVVADGLLSPRFVAVAADGTLYVTEVGTGGDEVLDLEGPPAPGEDGTPAPQLEEAEEASPEAEGEEGPPATRGYTGQVTVVTPDGTQAVLSTSFASYSDGVGPHGITIGPDGLIYVAVGGAGVGSGIEPLTGEATVFVIDPATGQPTALADLGSFEAQNNPDDTDVNPNLYDLTFGANGQLYVADAGGNTIYTVDPATGAFDLVAVVPELAGLTDATPPADEPDRQPVPTGLATTADGEILVALLSEGWPADAPSILQLEDDGSFTGVAEGLTMVVDVAVGPDGAIYATQLATGFGPEGPAPGNVLRIDADGSTEVVLDGLFLPHGIAFDDAGNLYVATGSVSFGPGSPAGQVLRCDGIAGAGAADATPVAATGMRAA